MMYFTTTVETDAEEDYYITIPDEILNDLKWKEGDTLNWEITDSKEIIITKIKDAEESGGKDQDSNISEATKEDYEDFWYNSESEGKDYDSHYDEYIQATAKETFGQAYHSPEGQGSWD